MNFAELHIRYYVTQNGFCPFNEWLDSISDKRIRRIIDSRLARIRTGNTGDCQHIGYGVWELRIHVSPGIRIYFAWHDATTVILLHGGKKDTQTKDILRSTNYWSNYEEQTKNK